MRRDPIRKKIHGLLRRRGAAMRDASLAVGRNRACMRQSLERGVPRVLSRRDGETLAAWLGCGADELRHESGAAPENVRILRARGDSMEPAVHDGDRLLVDIARKTPATGEMAVLWDGTGLVVKRVEVMPRTDPPRLRLISANPAYDPYDCLAGEAHIAGTVIWTLRRV